MAKGNHPCPKCGNHEIDFGTVYDRMSNNIKIGSELLYRSDSPEKTFDGGVIVKAWVCLECGYLQFGVPNVEDLKKHIKL